MPSHCALDFALTKDPTGALQSKVRDSVDFLFLFSLSCGKNNLVKIIS